MNIPNNLQYTKDHEWVKYEDNIALIGITDFAQSELGDVIFIELPNSGDNFKAGDSIGTIEAVKTVADIYTPLEGDIIEINKSLESTPELINNDPYNEGWIIKISFKKKINLLDANEYMDLIKFTYNNFLSIIDSNEYDKLFNSVSKIINIKNFIYT